MLQERLDRLESAIQAIAIETERIAEGQRFTTRLLSQHGSPTVPASGIPLPSFAEEALSASAAGQRERGSLSGRASRALPRLQVTRSGRPRQEP